MSDKRKIIRFAAKDDGTVDSLNKIRKSLRDLQTDLGNVEVGSQKFKELQGEIKQTKDRLDELNPKTRDYGKEVNKLTEYIRQEKMEQRQQNFMFAQMKDVVGTAAISLTALGMTGSDSMKTLSNSMNQGFIAFQGLDFLLKGVPGPWGMALSVIGGVAAAVFSFSQASAESVKNLADVNVKLIDVLFQMGEVSKEAKISVLEQAIAAAQLKMIEANSATKDWVSTIMSLFGPNSPVGPGISSLYTKLFGDPVAIKQAELEFANARKSLKEFFTDQEKLIKLPPPARALDFLPVSYGCLMADHAVQKFQKSVSKVAQTVKVELPKAFREVQVETDAVFNHIFDVANQSLNNIASAMQVGFEAAFSGAAGAGRIFIKSLASGFINMVEGMIIAAEAAALAKGIVSWGTTLIADLPKIALAFGLLEGARAVIGKLHQGGDIYFNAPPTQEAYVKVRGQETISVRTPEQKTVDHGITIVNNFYGPISDEEWVKNLVQEGLRRTGLEVNKYFRNNRGDLALT